ncbi:MAG: SDR family oxidoreductase [Caulobacteraceae bacterium]|nr:SDR family oxidoreductase [Caulobacteraceae bacterium]
MKVLEGKVALVTGATSGIGRGSAVALAAAGARVACLGRKAEAGSAVVAEIEALGGEAIFLRADVTVETEVEKAVADTVAALGGLDIAVNSAGAGTAGSLIDLTEAQYERTFNASVKGLWLSMKYEIRQMLAQGGGSVINLGSVQGRIAYGISAHYTAAKHAVEGYTKSAAVEFAAMGVRVNVVAPGSTRTPMNAANWAAHPEQTAQRMKAYPIGRFAEVDDIVGAIVFLASDAAAYITGASLVIDGGFTAT